MTGSTAACTPRTASRSDAARKPAFPHSVKRMSLCGRRRVAVHASHVTTRVATNAPPDPSVLSAPAVGSSVVEPCRTSREGVNRVEGLVGCMGRGGSSPLRRTRKAPEKMRGLSRFSECSSPRGVVPAVVTNRWCRAPLKRAGPPLPPNRAPMAAGPRRGSAFREGSWNPCPPPTSAAVGIRSRVPGR